MLPPKTRVVLALHYLADLSVEDIAAQTRSPTNTVKSHLSRGRARLRVLLDAETVGEPDRV